MKNAEQPAFPRAGSEHTNLADHITHEPTEGLTKREYFAAMAMQGLLSNSHYTKDLQDNFRNKIITDSNAMLVRESIDMADELLKQLES